MSAAGASHLKSVESSGEDAKTEAMRERMRVMGAGDEQISRLEDQLGAKGFTHHVEGVSTARAQADMVLDHSRETAGARLFEFYLLLQVLGVDASQPEAFNQAVATVHHLADHARSLGCDAAVRLAAGDPLRVAVTDTDQEQTQG